MCYIFHLARYQDRELDMGIRLGALRMYRSHLIDQYSDRCCFWSLRDLSCDLMSRTVTVVTDGADQAPVLKFWNVCMFKLVDRTLVLR